MTKQDSDASIAAKALNAAGDHQQAADVNALDAAVEGAQKKLGNNRTSLVERLIYGPQPSMAELGSGAEAMSSSATKEADAILSTALSYIAKGQAFNADKKLSNALREEVAAEKAYGFTIPVEYDGLGLNYSQFARLEESLVANGMGALAVELSGELTIGAGSLLGYGNEQQKSTYLPMIAEGHIMGFGLTEVGVGVNAKKIQAYVERDEENQCWRLFAEGKGNKLYITNATYGAILGIVARIGQTKRIGLFIIQLPDEDTETDFTFKCSPTNVEAFTPLHNSRLEFKNFPIPFENEVQADGVEILFYCLRLGRCMLSAMCAGYQRMFAADAANYARQRNGVGGLIIKHELPRLGLGKMLGGALVAQSLSHLALSQDAEGVDLAGLRDITKSAAASFSLESLIACERVIGGRSLDKGSRITEARSNIHAFGIVEGEDDLIRMGMVKDITSKFVNKYMSGLLGILQKVNTTKAGENVAPAERILSINLNTFFKHPLRSSKACLYLLVNPGLWKLVGWVVTNLLLAIAGLFIRLIPLGVRPRYRALSPDLRPYVYFAERRLRQCRWLYLGLSLFYQLELTRAQIPMQRLGQSVELLVSMLVLCTHASKQDESQQAVAALQSELIKNKLSGIHILRGLRATERLRKYLARIGSDIEQNRNTLINDIEPQQFAHPWEINSKPTKGDTNDDK